MLTVFISYSHDSPEHSDRVWDLCERLRQDGVDCCIDQHQTSPPEGWPRWCRNQVQECHFVLVVCTEAYNRRYEDKENPGEGLGARWEGFVITQQLYDAQGKNTRFIPIVFSSDVVKHIPLELRGATHYDLTSENGYEDLFRRLSDQPARRESEVGPLRKMPSQAPLERRQDFEGPIWTVPIPPNSLFTGRAQVLKDIGDALRSTGAAALAGLGGVGKTQTAARYAFLHRNEYKAVLWVAAASRDTLVSDFVANGSQLGLPQMTAEESVAAVKRWLETHRGWLLVFDNADDLGLLEEFIPAAGLGHVLLTTQAQATGPIAAAVEVADMPPEEGRFFLVRRAKLVPQQTAPQEVPVRPREVAEAISTELGGLPLALDQAGAFIEESGCGLSTYLDLYRECCAKLLGRRGSSAAGHPNSVAATFALSFEKIRQVSPAASDLLRLCAFLSPDAIPEEIFTSGCAGLGAILERVAGDPYELNVALKAILKYSLIRRDPNRKSLTVHRVVQAVLREGMTLEERGQWADRPCAPSAPLSQNSISKAGLSVNDSYPMLMRVRV